MDINSLLSPQDSPANETPPPPPAIPLPFQSPSKRAIGQMPSRTPSGLSQQVTPSSPAHAGYHHQHLTTMPTPSASPGVTSFPNGRAHSATNTPPIPSLGSPHDARMTPPHPMHRQASTPGMDTLAGELPFPKQGILARKKKDRLDSTTPWYIHHGWYEPRALYQETTFYFNTVGRKLQRDMLTKS